MIRPPQELGPCSMHDTCKDVYRLVWQRDRSLKDERKLRLLVAERATEVARLEAMAPADSSVATQKELELVRGLLTDEEAQLKLIEDTTDAYRAASQQAYEQALAAVIDDEALRAIPFDLLHHLVDLQTAVFTASLSRPDELRVTGEALLRLPVGEPMLFRDHPVLGPGWQVRMLATKPTVAVGSELAVGELPGTVIDFRVRSTSRRWSQVQICLQTIKGDPFESLANKGIYIGAAQIEQLLSQLRSNGNEHARLQAVLTGARFVPEGLKKHLS